MIQKTTGPHRSDSTKAAPNTSPNKRPTHSSTQTTNKRRLRVEHPHVIATLAPDISGDLELDAAFPGTPHDEYEPDLRHRMISEAAYGLFVERGFADGNDIDDWLRAEEHIDRQLSGAHIKRDPAVS